MFEILKFAIPAGCKCYDLGLWNLWFKAGRSTATWKNSKTKKDNSTTHFYTIVTKDTKDQYFSANR